VKTAEMRHAHEADPARPPTGIRSCQSANSLIFNRSRNVGLKTLRYKKVQPIPQR
jgi:hypothetical protein